MATKKNTTVRQNGKEYGYFKITKTIGHEWKDGKKAPVRKQFYGRSKRDAEQKYEDWIIAQESQNKGVRESVRTFGELCDFYTANVLAINAKYAKGTIERYKGAYEKFKENDKTGLLAMNIGNVTAADIQLAYNAFDVHESTVKALNKFLRGFFNWAILNQYCSDLLAAVTIPDKPKNKRKDEIVIWTDEELDTILTTLGNYRYRFLVVIAAYTGMRISEIFGLKYGDIDGNILHVRRQIYKGDVSDPKHKSFRDIPVHETVKKELAAHTARHKREMLKNGYRTEYIFTKDSCGMLRKASGSESSKIKAYKKEIDGLVFIDERQIPISLSGDMESCQRPLRAATPQGERVALANSEAVPAGSSIEFTVQIFDSHLENAVKEWLDYGKFRGIGQWRNSGKGRFEWEEIPFE